MSSTAPGRVIIVGLGVMGGSVAKALKRRAPRTAVIGIDPDDECAALASRDGVIRADALDQCDADGAVVVFAAPLDVTAALVRGTAPTWSRAAMATDVASLKVPVMDAASAGVASAGEVSAAGPRAGPTVAGAARARPVAAGATHARPVPAGAAPFIGAHPMCGSERSGYAASRCDLFEGADLWLCPPEGADSPADPARDSTAIPGRADREGVEAAVPLARAHAFWRLLGARPRTIAAEDHDRLMVWASHLPQLVSSALVRTLQDAGIARGALGPGGREMTRLAGSTPSMWLPLLEMARERDARALGALEERIGSLRRMLEEGDTAALARLMEKGGRWVSRTD